VSIINVRVAGEGQRPARTYHPTLYILTIDLAGSKRAAITIFARHAARPELSSSLVHELVARTDTAGPALALGVKAKLVRFGGVDSLKPYFDPADFDRVTIENSWNACHRLQRPLTVQSEFGGGGRADGRQPQKQGPRSGTHPPGRLEQRGPLRIAQAKRHADQSRREGCRVQGPRDHAAHTSRPAPP